MKKPCSIELQGFSTLDETVIESFLGGFGGDVWVEGNGSNGSKIG